MTDIPDDHQAGLADALGSRFADDWLAGLLADPPPDLVLDVIEGPCAGRSFPLTGHAAVAVGRHPGLHVCLPGDPYLSRAHCLIEVNPPLARVVDLCSKS